jgi:subtilisin family serine protease
MKRGGPGPRLPKVDPGGDFVESTDGLTDCDGHGTLIAGLIAGQPGGDGFSGVASAARLISIRQTSAKFSPRTPSADLEVSGAASDVNSLARAIVRAADRGARVINISAITCVPANKNIDLAELGAALRYAAVQKMRSSSPPRATTEVDLAPDRRASRIRSTATGRRSRRSPSRRGGSRVCYRSDR